MSTNGNNNWGVSYSHISWLEGFLKSHKNIKDIHRHHDLIFDITRVSQGDRLKVFCCNEYTMGLTMIQRAINEFGHIDIIYIGGGWCGYTTQAKDFCNQQKIGLYVTNEMAGAIWKNEYWNYHQKDQDGNQIHYSRI